MHHYQSVSLCWTHIDYGWRCKILLSNLLFCSLLSGSKHQHGNSKSTDISKFKFQKPLVDGYVHVCYMCMTPQCQPGAFGAI